MKYRISLTVEDYYDYVGTSHNLMCYHSLKERVLTSIPYEVKDILYNLKYKIVKKRSYRTRYRVHFSVNMEESKLLEMFKKRENYCHSLENVRIKKILRTPKGTNVV